MSIVRRKKTKKKVYSFRVIAIFQQTPNISRDSYLLARDRCDNVRNAHTKEEKLSREKKNIEREREQRRTQERIFLFSTFFALPKAHFCVERSTKKYFQQNVPHTALASSVFNVMPKRLKARLDERQFNNSVLTIVAKIYDMMRISMK